MYIIWCKVKLLNRWQVDINDKFRIGNLFDIYGGLLSEKQQKLIKCYYFDDMSLGEIAELENISRQAVLDGIKSGEKKLELYEQNIKMLKLKNNLAECLKHTDVKEKLAKLLEEI